MFWRTVEDEAKWRLKKNNAIDQREGTGTIITTEPDNEMKYGEEIDNTYTNLVHCKRSLSDLPKGTPRKAFINELIKLINEWSSKLPNWDICLNDTHRENSVTKYNSLNSVQEWLLGCFWPFSYVYTNN